MTIDNAATASKPRFSVANKIGFVLTILIGVLSLPSVLAPTPEGEVGPPLLVLAISSLLGVVMIIGAAIGWAKGSRAAIRAAAAALVVGIILTLPAFFTPEVPAALKAVAAAFTLPSIAAIVLILMPHRDSR